MSSSESYVNIYTSGRYVYIFTRDSTGRQIIFQDKSFYPYFYVPDEEGEYISIFGDRCRKITVDNPYEVKKQRERYLKTFEADIHYPNRYLVDNFNNVEEVPVRVQFIDLEMATDTKALPSTKDPKSPVISCCIYDSFWDRYFVFFWNRFLEFGKNEMVIEGKKVVVFKCPSEEDMLNCIVEFVKKSKPDVWCAWNGNGFDYPYMFNRFSLDVMKQMSPIKMADFDGYRFNLAGIALLDYLLMYKHMTGPYGQKESYSLDYISRIELGHGKKKCDWDFISKDVWEKYPDKIIEYNFYDVMNMVEIDKKRKIVKYFDTVRRVTKSMWEDVFHNSVVVDNNLLSFSKGKYVLPTRTKVKRKKVKGAFVKEPVKGLHRNVADFDAAALYPNLILSFNLSPDALDRNGEIKIESVRFRKEPMGLIPQCCKYLMETRKKYKDKMLKCEVGSEEYVTYDMAQQAFKYLVNSNYGFFAYPGSRFYNAEVANAVTYLGREFTKWVGTLAEENGYRFLYADTDSIWINLNSDSIERCIVEAEEFEELVNGRMGEFTRKFGVKRHTLSIRFEKLFSNLYFAGKKRYCGLMVWKEGVKCNVEEYKGFEVKRSDTPQVAKEFMKGFLKKILKGETKEKIDKYVNEFIKRVRDVPVEDLGFPVGTKAEEEYKSEPIHIRAMKYSQKCNLEIFYPGEKIKYIFVKKVPDGLPSTDVIAFKERFPSGFVVDYDRVIDRIVWMKVDPIYRALGWKVDDSRQLDLVDIF